MSGFTCSDRQLLSTQTNDCAAPAVRWNGQLVFGHCTICLTTTSGCFEHAAAHLHRDALRRWPAEHGLQLRTVEAFCQDNAVDEDVEPARTKSPSWASRSLLPVTTSQRTRRARRSRAASEHCSRVWK